MCIGLSLEITIFLSASLSKSQEGTTKWIFLSAFLLVALLNPHQKGYQLQQKLAHSTKTRIWSRPLQELPPTDESQPWPGLGQLFRPIGGETNRREVRHAEPELPLAEMNIFYFPLLDLKGIYHYCTGLKKKHPGVLAKWKRSISLSLRSWTVLDLVKRKAWICFAGLLRK